MQLIDHMILYHYAKFELVWFSCSWVILKIVQLQKSFERFCPSVCFQMLEEPEKNCSLRIWCSASKQFLNVQLTNWWAWWKISSNSSTCNNASSWIKLFHLMSTDDRAISNNLTNWGWRETVPKLKQSGSPNLETHHVTEEKVKFFNLINQLNRDLEIER